MWQRGGARSPRSRAATHPLRCRAAAVGVFQWCQIAEAAVRPYRVVVDLPPRQGGAGMSERAEQGLVQQFVAQPAVKAFDESVLLRLTGCDVVPFDAGLLRP